MRVWTIFVLLAVAMGMGASRPNILWISSEDISPHLGCYGYPEATTPNLDRLAQQGVRFTNAHTVTGVCATCRNSMITGMYPSTLGSQFMRCKVKLPGHVRLFPEYFRDAGYYCTNNSKTDYNIPGRHGDYWDESSRKAHWRNRPNPDQPFFAVFNFTNTHESKIFKYKRPENLTDAELHDPQKMTVPPYYPDTPITRTDWAHYYDNITSMDKLAAEILEQLEADGLAENTIVVYWSDHGAGLPRAKRWIYESGTRVPLIVRIPDALRSGDAADPGKVSDELVSLMDLPVAMMNLAGLDIPDHVHGRPFLGPNRSEPREFVYTIRDRMDERYDIIRAVRNQRYKYIRNYQSFKPYFQVINYMEQEHTMKELRRLDAAGQLHPAAAQFMADSKPLEELYDLQSDPHEIDNLIHKVDSDDQLHQQLETLRKAHRDWVFETLDTGLIPEAELAVRAKQLGTRYQILQQTGAKQLLSRLLEVNQFACSQDPGHLQALVDASTDSDAAVRFWALTGIGNLRAQDTASLRSINRGLTDASGSVRVAAARAAWKAGRIESALPVVEAAAKSPQEFLSLMAMHLIDDMDNEAKPIWDAVRWVKENGEGYPVRVAEYLLN